MSKDVKEKLSGKLLTMRKIIAAALTTKLVWPDYMPKKRCYPHQSDLEAMRGDWVRVGEDMRRAMSYISHPARKDPKKEDV